MSMVLISGERFTVFNPDTMNRWTNGKTTVLPLSVIGDSTWARNERDGSLLNYKTNVFMDLYNPIVEP